MAPAPSSFGRLAAMMVFCLSCFGLLVFLWSSFGGALPLEPRGYRFSITLRDAGQLAAQGEVRISGVPVGRVVGVTRGRVRSRAELEIDPRFAPIAADTRVVLRSKTLLGETFVELTPGDRAAGTLAENASLPSRQVVRQVRLDEVLDGFDPATRRDLRRVLRGTGRAVGDRGEDLNTVLGHLPPIVGDTRSLTAVLAEHRVALGGLTRDAGTVLGTVGRRQDDVRSLVTDVEAVLARTARRAPDLQRALRALPAVLAELSRTAGALSATAAVATPTLEQLRPAARRLGPALVAARRLAPEAERLLRALPATLEAADHGLPSSKRLLRRVGPLLDQIAPFTRDLLPVADYLGLQKDDVAQALANAAASAQASGKATDGRTVRYLRTVVAVTEHSGANATTRSPTVRSNAYAVPGALQAMATGSLRAFDCTGARPGAVSPPCLTQEPVEFQGRRRAYPHVERP